MDCNICSSTTSLNSLKRFCLSHNIQLGPHHTQSQASYDSFFEVFSEVSGIDTSELQHELMEYHMDNQDVVQTCLRSQFPEALIDIAQKAGDPSNLHSTPDLFWIFFMETKLRRSIFVVCNGSHFIHICKGHDVLKVLPLEPEDEEFPGDKSLVLAVSPGMIFHMGVGLTQNIAGFFTFSADAPETFSATSLSDSSSESNSSDQSIENIEDLCDDPLFLDNNTDENDTSIEAPSPRIMERPNSQSIKQALEDRR